MSVLYKNCICLIIALLLFFGINISSVMAQDCEYLKEAISYMGDKLKNEFEETPDCCKMKYITCNSFNRITSIKISDYTDSSADLNKFIKNLNNLDFLYTLELINIVSNTKKSLPTELGSLKSLKNLKFNDNKVDYEDSTIPSSLGNLSNLQHLELQNNGLTGSIPKSLGKLNKLLILNLNKNNLSGTIPYDFKSLVLLKNLYLDRNNDLYGYVPLLNINFCNYSETDLCYLPGASCKSGLSSCTTEQIKNTNNDNGSPYPNTDKYEKAIGTTNGVKRNANSSFSYLFTLIFFFILFCLCCCRNKNKQKPHAFALVHTNNPTTLGSSNNTSTVQAISPVAAVYYPPTSQTVTTNYPPTSQTVTTNYPPTSQTATTSYPPPSPYAAPINPTSYNNVPYTTPNVSYNNTSSYNPYLNPSYNNGQMPMPPYGGMPQYGAPNSYYPPVSQVSPAIMPQAGSFDSREITPPQSIPSAPGPSMSPYDVPPPPYTQSPSAPDQVGPSSSADNDNKARDVELANETNKDIDSKESNEKDNDSKEKATSKE